MNLKKQIINISLAFFLVSSFSIITNAQLVRKSSKNKTLITTSENKNWEKLATIPQKGYLQIIPNDFAVCGENPVLALTQLLEYNGGGEEKKEKEFQIFKLNNNQWERIRYIKTNGQSRFSNLECYNNELYMIFGWQELQKFDGKDWINIGGTTTIAPPPAKKSYSYYPILKFDKDGKAITLWEDASYIEKGYLKGGSWLSASEFENGKWKWLGKRAFGKDVARPLLSISNGKYYALFKDYEESVYINHRSVISMMVYENGKWNYLGKRAFNEGNISGTSMDFAVYNGIPYALYTYEDKWTGSYKERINRIVLMAYKNDAWQAVGDLKSTGAIYHLNLRFSKEGIPYVAYIDNFKKIRICRFNGKVWDELGVLGSVPFSGTISKNQWVASNQLHHLLFDLSTTDVPFVVFTQTSRIRTKNKPGDVANEQIFVFKYTGQ